MMFVLGFGFSFCNDVIYIVIEVVSFLLLLFLVNESKIFFMGLDCLL